MLKKFIPILTIFFVVFLANLSLAQEFNPQLVGSTVVPYTPSMVKVNGDYVYLAGPGSGPGPSSPGDKSKIKISIVDIKDKSNPKLVGDITIDESKSSNEEIKDFDVGGDYLYALTTHTLNVAPYSSTRIYVISIADKSKPTLVSYKELGSYGLGARQIKVKGNYAYIARFGSSPTNKYPGSWPYEVLSIYDISNKQDIKLATELNFNPGVFLKNHLGSFDIKNNYLFMTSKYSVQSFTGIYSASLPSYLYVVDISNPLAPSVISKTGLEQKTVSGVSLNYAKNIPITISNNFAYVINEDDFLKIIDISNPLAPKIVNTIKFENPLSPLYPAIVGIKKYDLSKTTINSEDNLLYVGLYANGLIDLKIYDVSNPSQPSLKYSHESFDLYYNNINHNLWVTQTYEINKKSAYSFNVFYDISANVLKSNFRIVGLFSSTITPPPTPPTTLIPSGKVLDMKFDEAKGTQALDSSGNKNHGTLVSGATWSSSSECIKGSCLKFDGVDDYIQINSQNGIPKSGNPRTISAWINPTNISPGGAILSYGDGGGGEQEYILLAATVSNVQYLFTDGINVNNNIQISGNEIPMIGKWSHITFTLDSNNWKYYLNGVLVKSGTFSTPINTGANGISKLFIGDRTDGYNMKFPGLLDEVKIYNYSLSSAEVQQIYDTEKSITISLEGDVCTTDANCKQGLQCSTDSSTNTKACCPTGKVWDSQLNLCKVLTQPFDFSFTSLQTSSSITQGEFANVQLNAEFKSGNTKAVVFSCSNLPSGVSCTFDPSTCNLNCASSLKISTSSSTVAGNYVIDIKAIAGGIEKKIAYALTVNVPTPPPPPPPGKVLDMKFDEAGGTQAQDSSGLGNHGTIVSGPTWSSSSECIKGACLKFDGIDDYVKVTASSSLDTRNKITISAWIKPEGNSIQPIIEYNSGNSIGVHLWQFDTFNKLYTNFVDSGGVHHQVFSPATISAGNFYHVVTVYDGNTVKEYINGVEVASSQAGLFTLKTSYDLYIGKRPYPSSFYFKGTVDEVKIWNYALTATEVQQIYFAEAPPPTPPTSQNSCSGKCGVYDRNARCQCDVNCKKYGDCCNDYDNICLVSTPPPTAPTPPTPPSTGALLSENFDSATNIPAGWQASGLWHLSSKRSSSAVKSARYADASKDNYDVGQNSGSLATPSINLPASGNIELRVNSWHRTESENNYDIKIISLIKPDETKSELLRINKANENLYPQQSWNNINLNLNNYAGQTVKIEFKFDSVDRYDNTYEGWYIDNVIITSTSSAPATGAVAKSLKAKEKSYKKKTQTPKKNIF